MAEMKKRSIRSVSSAPACHAVASSRRRVRAFLVCSPGFSRSSAHEIFRLKAVLQTLPSVNICENLWMIDSSHSNSAADEIPITGNWSATQSGAGFVHVTRKETVRWRLGTANYAGFPWIIARFLSVISRSGNTNGAM